MTVKEIDKSVKNMKKYTKKVTSSKSKSRAFLAKAGICSPSGQLTKTYK